MLKEIIQKEIIKLREEFKNESNILYGYHVTGKNNLDSINDNGFRVGSGKMQGKGFYGFYDYGHGLRYLMKDNPKNLALVKFGINCKGCLLYLNMDIAKSVLGNKYHLKDQVEKYFKYDGGLQYILDNSRTSEVRTMEELILFLDEIENNNTEGNQRKFVFNLIPESINNSLNIAWDGNYGLEYRINYMNIIKPLGYYLYDGMGGEEYHNFKTKELIPTDNKFDILRDYIDNNTEYSSTEITKDNLLHFKSLIKKYLETVRNNRDFIFFNKLYDLINDII